MEEAVLQTEWLCPRRFIHSPACGQGCASLKPIKLWPLIHKGSREEVASFPVPPSEFTQVQRFNTKAP